MHCVVRLSRACRRASNTWWFVIDGRDVDMCSVDPDHDVDPYVLSTIRSMTAVWMAQTTLKAEI
jgi:hypothetical protein